MTATYQILRRRTQVALAVSIVFVLISVMSFVRQTSVSFDHCVVAVTWGGIAFAIFHPDIDLSNAIKVAPAESIRWLPSITGYSRNMMPLTFLAFIPMWCIAPFVFIPTFFLWRIDRRIPDGHCQRCGYNLTGNVSGKCPECGAAL